MYICDICKKVTKSGEKQNKKILKTRKKIYHYFDKYGNEKTSEGREIVKEINVCDECFSKKND